MERLEKFIAATIAGIPSTIPATPAHNEPLPVDEVEGTVLTSVDDGDGDDWDGCCICGNV